MLIDMIPMQMMQMTIMQIVDVIAMLVVVVFMMGEIAVAHQLTPLLSDARRHVR